ncbi:consortin [Pholidichthys leucotaenia]
MDHDGQCEMEDGVMSHAQVDQVNLCDNLPNPEALTVHTQNLNETKTLTQTYTLPLPQNEGAHIDITIQNMSFNNNGKKEVVEEQKEAFTRSGVEEEAVDEVMKEEEDESEGSSCQIRCQSPDTPMTDSSYSETGSLLDTPYAFSPGTSPEPTSPVIPVVSPETVCSEELRQSDAVIDFRSSNAELVISTTGSTTITCGPTVTTGPMDSSLQTASLGSGSTCITTTADIAKNTNFSTEQLTSFTEPFSSCGPTYASSCAGAITSATKTLTALTRLNSSVSSTPVEATQEPHILTTEPPTTVTESISTKGPISSALGITCFSLSNPNPALLESLKQLAQRGDDTNLPQHLHQIAEAFVLQEDYQCALWCLHLERLYHQRVLDNLNALQEQWESRCGRTPSDLATQHLDTLKDICQTHSRPRARDAESVSGDSLIPNSEGSGVLSSCISAHQSRGGMEQRAADSFYPVMPSINLPDGPNSPENSYKDREDPCRDLDGNDTSQLTDKQSHVGGVGEAGGGEGDTTSVIGNGLHPSTAGEMDQSMPAELQGEDLGPAQEKEAKEEEEEESDVEEAEEALEMEDGEGEEEEDEAKNEELDSHFSQNRLPVETLVSGAEVESQQLHQDAPAHDKLNEATQLCQEIQEAHHSQEADMKQQEQPAEVKEEEEVEEDYDPDQADIIREAPSLDAMAKLITVEEISPATGLVSILKKRSASVDNTSVSFSSEARLEKPTAKRRVRFKVPDDGYDQDVGGDSCLLLFLLCLITVMISLGGTAFYCALGDAHSSVCQDFSRNADFYIGQIRRGIAQIQYWFAPGS